MCNFTIITAEGDLKWNDLIRIKFSANPNASYKKTQTISLPFIYVRRGGRDRLTVYSDALWRATR